MVARSLGRGGTWARGWRRPRDSTCERRQQRNNESHRTRAVGGAVCTGRGRSPGVLGGICGSPHVRGRPGGREACPPRGPRPPSNAAAGRWWRPAAQPPRTCSIVTIRALASAGSSGSRDALAPHTTCRSSMFDIQRTRAHVHAGSPQPGCLSGLNGGWWRFATHALEVQAPAKTVLDPVEQQVRCVAASSAATPDRCSFRVPRHPPAA